MNTINTNNTNNENINERQKKIISEFSNISDWEVRYKKIIEMGKSLSQLPEEFYVEDLKVKGCQSQVWLKADFVDEKVFFRGDSDALIVKGLLSLVLYVYSGSTPEEIISTSPEFIKILGFEKNLTPSRTNGLFSMIKQIKFYGTAYLYAKNL